MAAPKDIRYLNPPTAEAKKKKYCRFQKSGIKYIDYMENTRATRICYTYATHCDRSSVFLIEIFQQGY